MLRARTIVPAWVAAMLVGEGLGFGLTVAIVGALARNIGLDSGEGSPLLAAAVATLAGVVEGSILGLAQWTVLRRRLPRLPSLEWIRSTALGAAVAWVLGMWVGSHGPGQPPSAQLVVAGIVVTGLALGGILGTAQWLVLRRWVAESWKWIVANALGWMVGLIAAYVAIDRAHGQAPAASFAIAALGGAIMAVVPALATGWTLERLTRRDAVA